MLIFDYAYYELWTKLRGRLVDRLPYPYGWVDGVQE